MPGARWFPGGTLNYAEHALAAGADRGPTTSRSSPAARPARRRSSRGPQLADGGGPVPGRAACASACGAGDRVAAYLPNIPETIVAFLATASLGAIWSSCAPEFGVRSVVDRFAQIEPTVLLAVDGYRYGEKVVDKRADVEAIEAALPTLRHTVHVLVPRATGADDWTRAARRARPARVRAGAVRPPALRALQLGHHRACRRRSCTATAASPSSTSRPSRCTTTSAPATGSSGSPPPAG